MMSRDKLVEPVTLEKKRGPDIFVMIFSSGQIGGIEILANLRKLFCRVKSRQECSASVIRKGFPKVNNCLCCKYSRGHQQRTLSLMCLRISLGMGLVISTC